MPFDEDENHRPRALSRFIAASVAAAIAEGSTYPLDMTKTHLQLRRERMDSRFVKPGSMQMGLKYFHSHGKLDPAGMVESAKIVVRTQGFLGLFRGVQPAIARAVLNNSISITMYRPMLSLFHNENEFESSKCLNAKSVGQSGLLDKILAAGTTGAISQCLANPVEVVKVRMQADAMAKKPRYAGISHTVQHLIRTNPLLLWRGLGPAVCRSSMSVSATIATYHHTKQTLVNQYSWTDPVCLATMSSACSGLVASICSCPPDNVKTRMMAQEKIEPPRPHSHYPQSISYRSAWHCLRNIVRQEGVFTLFRGLVPTYSRLGPWQLIFFVCYECLSTAAFDQAF